MKSNDTDKVEAYWQDELSATWRLSGHGDDIPNKDQVSETWQGSSYGKQWENKT